MYKCIIVNFINKLKLYHWGLQSITILKYVLQLHFEFIFKIEYLI